jgi:K+-sensing histidine kinase KdpD
MPNTEDAPGRGAERAAWLRHLAHDLRSPLSPLQTGVSMLRSGRLSEGQQSDLLDAMQRQLNALIQVIDDTGDLLAQRNPAMTGVDVGSLLDMVSVRTRLQFQEAGLQFEVRAPDTPVAVTGDARDLVRLLGYLAMRLGEMHGPGSRVTASTRLEGTWLELQLSVDGGAVEELAAFVDRLSQADPAGVTDAVLHRILQRHGAELRPTRGAGLLLRLPSATATV